MQVPVIRDAILADIKHIQELAEKTWWPSYSSILTPEQIRYMLDVLYSVETLEKVMKDGSQHFILISDGRGDQGFASYGIKKDDHQSIKLHKLYVLPENQGKGYGKLLIEEVSQRSKKDGYHSLDLNVNRYNPAKNFYEKLGFKILREEDIPIGPYWMNDYVMRLDLGGVNR